MTTHRRGGNRFTRRSFMGGAAAAAAAAFTIVPRHVLGAGQVPPSEKMNIGCVGIGGMQGAGDARNVSGENIYAICDVDQSHIDKLLAPDAKNPNKPNPFTKAKQYRDFRKMLDAEAKNLNGITVTVPDHMHATISLWAMERGIAVHCQKPLTQTVWEARQVSLAARKYKVPTQMGNQGYSSEATRVACEIIWRGDIGDVTEVHAWHGGGFARGITEWPAQEEVPATLDWDLWTGRAAMKPFSKKIAPINWRGFLDYGTMMIGDWGIHILGPSNWALQLGAPESVECIAVEGANPVTYPNYACKLVFPERPNKFVPGGKMPPVTLYWYEGSVAKNIKIPGLKPEDLFKGCNEVFVGTKGFLGTSGRGEGVRMIPEDKNKDFKKPDQVIKRIQGGHFQDWIRACKGGEMACSDFSISGPYTEWMLLGAISWRFPNTKLLWDGKNLRFTNNDQANAFVKPVFRKGWELPEIKA